MNEQNNPPTIKILTQNFFTSFTCSSLIDLIGAPYGKLKLNLFVMDDMLRKGILDRPYLGMVDCAKRIVQEKGLKALWNGNYGNYLRYVRYQTLTFTIFYSLNSLYFQVKILQTTLSVTHSF